MSDWARVLAVDPGPDTSGWVEVYAERVGAGGGAPQRVMITDAGCMANADLLERVRVEEYDMLAVEDMVAMRRPFGADIARTCRMIGRLEEAFEQSPDAGKFVLISRPDVAGHVTGSRSARDPQIRQALIDIWGRRGTKKAPGPTYLVTSHAWSALAVATAVLNLHYGCSLVYPKEKSE